MPSPLDRTPQPAAVTAAREDAQSQALRAQIERHLADVRALPEVQAAIVLAMRESLAALRTLPSELYTRKWFEQREREIKDQARQALDDAEAPIAERLERIREQATAATRREPGSVADQQLNELRVQSAWLSLKDVLSQASQQADPLAAIEVAAERAASDPTRAEALRRYGADWIAGTFAGQPRYARERIQHALGAGVERADAATWTPTQRAAHELLREVDRGAGRLLAGSREARNEIEGRRTAAALAGWADGAIIALTHRGQPAPAAAVRVALGEAARTWDATAARTYPLLSEQGATALTTNAATNRAADVIRQLGGTLAAE